MSRSVLLFAGFEFPNPLDHRTQLFPRSRASAVRQEGGRELVSEFLALLPLLFLYFFGLRHVGQCPFNSRGGNKCGSNRERGF